MTPSNARKTHPPFPSLCTYKTVPSMPIMGKEAMPIISHLGLEDSKGG